MYKGNGGKKSKRGRDGNCVGLYAEVDLSVGFTKWQQFWNKECFYDKWKVRETYARCR